MPQISDIADMMRSNGYMPVPLVPNEKAIRIERWSLLAATGEYDQLWQNVHPNSNIGIYTGQNVIIMDFDAHGEHPSVVVYTWLMREHPEIFVGAIIEKTPSGGIHVTYRWCSNAISLPTGKGKTYARFEIDGVTYDIELLTRGSQAVCPPSRTPAGEYRYLSERTHLNTRRDDLPVLPELFRDANNSYLDAVMLASRQQRPSRKQTAPDDFTDEELQAAVDALPEIYLRRAHEGHRHYQALGLSCNVAGIRGMSRGDVERIVREFFRSASREPNSKNEIDGIVAFGMANPDSTPFIPASAIYKLRQRYIIQKYKAMMPHE